MKEYRQAMGELENYGKTHNIPEVRGHPVKMPYVESVPQ
jgi:hypothetical protein